MSYDDPARNVLSEKYPSFFTEQQADRWMIKMHETTEKLGIMLLRAFIPMVGSGTAIAMLVFYMMLENDSIYSATLALILIEMVVFIITNCATRNMLVFYILERYREVRGLWFAGMKCGCREWIKVLTPSEIKNCTNAGGKNVVKKCPACKVKGDAECKKCMNDGLDRETCRRCKKDVMVIKMWTKKVRWNIYKRRAKNGDGDAKNGHTPANEKH